MSLTHRNGALSKAISGSEKWRGYFSTHCKQPDHVSSQQLFVEKVELAKTVEIPSQCELLNESTASQILMNRFAKEEIKKQLLRKWVSPESDGVNCVDKEIIMDWKNATKDVDFKLYV
jgi:hypothetical protein